MKIDGALLSPAPKPECSNVCRTRSVRPPPQFVNFVSARRPTIRSFLLQKLEPLRFEHQTQVWADLGSASAEVNPRTEPPRLAKRRSGARPHRSIRLQGAELS